MKEGHTLDREGVGRIGCREIDQRRGGKGLKEGREGLKEGRD